MAKTTSEKIHLLVECAIMIALGTVLSLIKVYEAPYGGSVTLLSMAPMILLSLRRGVKVGLPAAFVYSVLQLILGLSSVAWVPSIGGKFWCIILDYILAFTVLGLGGIFRNVRFSKNETTNLFVSAILGALLATVLRFISREIFKYLSRRID